MLAIGLSSSSRMISVPAVAGESNDLPPTPKRCWVTELSAFGSRIHWSFFSPLMSILHSCEVRAAAGPGCSAAWDGSSARGRSSANAAPHTPARATMPTDRHFDIARLPFAGGPLPHRAGLYHDRAV